MKGIECMNKNKIRLNICGSECTITSDDNETYVLAIGDEVEKSMKGIMEKNDRVSLTMAAIITALSFCDETHKAVATADNLRSQIKDYLEDSSRCRLEADEARREIERMKREIQTLRARLSGGEPPKNAAPGPAKQATHAPQPGAYSRPQPAPQPPKAKTDDEPDGFMSFFEKKEAD